MKQDPTRIGWIGMGILVRAISTQGRYTAIDIGELDKESLAREVLSKYKSEDEDG